jgi:hypothetical protein
MDLYNTLSSWAGWPATVAFLLLAGAFGLRVWKNHIEVLREKIKWLETQLKSLEEKSPDVLAKRLSDRYHIAEEELERLRTDQEVSQETIRKKEAELARTKFEMVQLKGQLEKAQQWLSDSGLVCPYCGAPLETREYHMKTVEYGGRDLDIDHELIRYECGFEIVDGKVLKECPEGESGD